MLRSFSTTISCSCSSAARICRGSSIDTASILATAAATSPVQAVSMPASCFMFLVTAPSLAPSTVRTNSPTLCSTAPFATPPSPSRASPSCWLPASRARSKSRPKRSAVLHGSASIAPRVRIPPSSTARRTAASRCASILSRPCAQSCSMQPAATEPGASASSRCWKAEVARFTHSERSSSESPRAITASTSAPSWWPAMSNCARTHASALDSSTGPIASSKARRCCRTTGSSEVRPRSCRSASCFV
mmetsp:Transcript_20872/g.50427  ORF Transcript_20872/g.50427 Transcript_20872/m.50427 type:complete len:247 (-) Transcript_20872:4081-4821(-)